MKRISVSGTALAAGCVCDCGDRRSGGRPRASARSLNVTMGDGPRASALSLRSRNASRRGVTLTEVLMSLMIMSIGVSAVAVLFPISVLRSVQATQLTNAAILKTNAETLLNMRTELVFDPDGDGNIQEHVGRTEELHYIVDPGGYFEMATGATFSSGVSYASQPWLNSDTYNNRTTVPNDVTYRGGADWFGNVDTDSDGVPEPFAFLPRYDGGIRFATVNGSFPTGFLPQGGDPEEARALRSLGATLSKLGDAWDTQFEGLPEEFVFSDGSTSPTALAGASIVGVKFSVDADLSGVPTAATMVPRISGTQIISDPEVCRAVIFSLDGNFSVALPLTASYEFPPSPDPNAQWHVLWSEDGSQYPPPVVPPVFNGVLDAGEDLNLSGNLNIRTLPPQFINPLTGNYEIGRVLLQTSRTHDYNWLLTVRRGRDGQARGVDVVITHNKGITPDDERLYTAEFLADSYVVRMILDGGLKADLEPAEPALRKSGYILDVENARWYRIRDYREEKGMTIGTVSGDGYIITIETPVLNPSISGKAMFLPGVVDVYPMGSIPIPTNL